MIDLLIKDMASPPVDSSLPIRVRHAPLLSRDRAPWVRGGERTIAERAAKVPDERRVGGLRRPGFGVLTADWPSASLRREASFAQAPHWSDPISSDALKAMRRRLPEQEVFMNYEEIEQRNITVMGDVLGKQYSVLFNEVTALHFYWQEFIQSFGTNDERINRLNRSAPGFFAMLQNQQFETNMMHIARLTDPVSSAGRKNLTLLNLPSLVLDAGLNSKLTLLVEDAKNKSEFARSWRNRRFAHNDLLLAIQDGKATPLPRATKDEVNAALAAFAEVLNAIEHHYYSSVCDFNEIMAQDGVTELLFTLGFGVKAKDEMEAKIASRQFDDLGAPETI
jgi:hypothetical protein